jgi:pimeloyl-ACP methyl ester carboxylesterase
MAKSSAARSRSNVPAGMRYRLSAVIATGLMVGGTAAVAQDSTAPQRPPVQHCAAITQAHADESAGTPNVNHDGSALPGIPAPDISRGFQGIPRSAQPPLTASQKRILECTYHFAEADADMPYALFVPSSYAPGTPAPLIVDLHGLNITPLQQMLFDGTTDLADRFGFIVVAPMGYSLSGWWGARSGRPGELSELDAMTLLKRIRQEYSVDRDRIYLMGHSMGGAGTYHLAEKYSDIWAAVAPISAAGGITGPDAAQRFRSFATLLMHGENDSIVSVEGSRRAAQLLEATGAEHLYLEFPGKDHEFWIRRGADNLEKVFLFFATVSKQTHHSR